MKLIDRFFREVDQSWRPIGGEPIRLRLIGSAALMLQTDYERGTKDGDILESAEITPSVKDQLLALAGPRAPLHLKHGLFLEVVRRAILFWPQKPVFHPVATPGLRHFSIEVLDATDVAITKLKRLNEGDVKDIRELTRRKLLDHEELVARFKDAIDYLSTSAYADDFPKCVANLNRIERDVLQVPESKIELPDWLS